jgi:hypothetical protein
MAPFQGHDELAGAGRGRGPIQTSRVARPTSGGGDQGHAAVVPPGGWQPDAPRGAGGQNVTVTCGLWLLDQRRDRRGVSTLSTAASTGHGEMPTGEITSGPPGRQQRRLPVHAPVAGAALRACPYPGGARAECLPRRPRRPGVQRLGPPAGPARRPGAAAEASSRPGGTEAAFPYPLGLARLQRRHGPHLPQRGAPCHGVVDPRVTREGLSVIPLGYRPHLKAKAGGEKSMVGKAGQDGTRSVLCRSRPGRHGESYTA